MTTDRMVLLPDGLPTETRAASCTFRLRSHGHVQQGPIVTAAALDRFGEATIASCLVRLQEKAAREGGLDYLQVFEDPQTKDQLWFIEDAPGLVTALLPDDY